jgi:hypothetical protein
MRRKQGKEGAKMARGKDPCFHPGKFPTQCLMFPLFQDEKRELKKEVMHGSWRDVLACFQKLNDWWKIPMHY